jgi:hypothetical protein
MARQQRTKPSGRGGPGLLAARRPRPLVGAVRGGGRNSKQDGRNSKRGGRKSKPGGRKSKPGGRKSKCLSFCYTRPFNEFKPTPPCGLEVTENTPPLILTRRGFSPAPGPRNRETTARSFGQGNVGRSRAGACPANRCELQSGRSAFGEGGFPSPLWGRVREGGRATLCRLVPASLPRNFRPEAVLRVEDPYDLSFARPPTPTRPQGPTRAAGALSRQPISIGTQNGRQASHRFPTGLYSRFGAPV